MNSNTSIIPDVPYFSGPGWMPKHDAWVKENIPAAYQDAVRSEAMISWNRSGGSPSSYFHSAAASVVSALNAGREPEFPNVEWNKQFLKQQKARLATGVAYGAELDLVR